MISAISLSDLLTPWEKIERDCGRQQWEILPWQFTTLPATGERIISQRETCDMPLLETIEGQRPRGYVEKHRSAEKAPGR